MAQNNVLIKRDSRENLSLLALAKINALLACSQMLEKTIRYPSVSDFIFLVQTLLSSYKLNNYRTNFIFFVQTLLSSYKLNNYHTNFIFPYKLYYHHTNFIFLVQALYRKGDLYMNLESFYLLHKRFINWRTLYYGRVLKRMGCLTRPITTLCSKRSAGEHMEITEKPIRRR